MYVILWEFEVRQGCEEELVAANKPGGTWSRLFQQDPAYLGTEVLRQTPRLVTIDRWISREAYEAFRDAHRAEYEAIDSELERLTENEHHIGSFESA